jgi:hypothetical protein
LWKSTSTRSRPRPDPPRAAPRRRRPWTPRPRRDPGSDAAASRARRSPRKIRLSGRTATERLTSHPPALGLRRCRPSREHDEGRKRVGRKPHGNRRTNPLERRMGTQSAVTIVGRRGVHHHQSSTAIAR